MLIGIDASRCDAALAGVGRYSTEMVRHLVAHRRHRYRLYANGAEGDIAPRRPEGGSHYEEAQNYGRRVGIAAARLAQGDPMETAVRRAKDYITGAIQSGAEYAIGHGHGPVHHFWRVWA